MLLFMLLKKNVNDTTLYIGTKILKDSIHIMILDDGIGIQSAKLNQIIESLDLDNDFNSNHVGIANVHKRVKMIYGQKYGVEIVSEKDEGTKISIILPTKIKQYGGEVD